MSDGDPSGDHRVEPTGPLVTIITPVYNGARYIAEVIESVLAQGYQPLEYIVIDDGSTDDTRALLEPYKARGVTVLSHPNRGEAATVNRGAALAKGEILAIVNADDPVLPGLIAAAVELLTARPDLAVVYPDWLKIDSDGAVIEEVRTQDFDYRMMLRQHFCIPGPGAFIRRSALAGEELRDSSLKYSSDFDLWLRLGLRGGMARIPRVLATWRFHDQGASQAQRNPRMAAEKPLVIEKLFRRPDVPDDLRVEQAQALSAACYCAGLLAIHNPAIPGWRYLIRSLYLRPFWPDGFLRSQRRSWPHMAFVFGQPLTGALRRMLTTGRKG